MFDNAKRDRDLAEIRAAIENWPEADAALLEERINHSLREVTHLTEYEDEKASRIMTAMAFVGALVAAVHALALQFIFYPAGWIYHAFNFCLCGFYFLAVVASGWVVWGIKPRFNIKKKNRSPRPFSLIFAPEVERVSGTVWANEFVGKSPDALKALSSRNQLSEVKLVAHKAWKKVGHLKLATNLYLVSLFCLSFGIVALGFGMANKIHSPAHAVIVFDADNTLWDTNALFSKAQVGLVTGLEKLTGRKVTGDKIAYLRRFDEEIAATNPQGFRYPIRLLIDRIYTDLNGKASDQSLESEFAKLGEEYGQMIADAPTLFPGVRDTLQALSTKGYRLILLSEGNPVHVSERLIKNDIRGYFYEVLVRKKTPEVFSEIKAANQSSELTIFVSVGDRLDVDLENARQVGYRTIHVPGGFRPYEAINACLKPDGVALTLSEVPTLVENYRQPSIFGRSP